MSSAKKRKRPLKAPLQLNPDLEVIDVKDDDDGDGQPLNKKKPRSPVAGPSTEGQEFRVPSWRGTGSNVITLPSISALSRSDRNEDKDTTPPPSPTLEQEQATRNIRQMRKAVIGVISDVHDEILANGYAALESIKELLENLWICWEKYPLMFSSLSTNTRLTGDDNEDISGPQEIKDFMYCWLHGLLSLITQPNLEDGMSSEFAQLLITFSKMLADGNPELLEYGFAEILSVMGRVLAGNGKPIDFVIEYKDPANDQLEQDEGIKMTIRYNIPRDSDSIEDILDVLGALLPRALYFNATTSPTFISLLHKVWGYLVPKLRFKLLTSFLIPVMSEINLMTMTSELSFCNFLSRAICEGVKIQDVEGFSHFQLFIDQISFTGLPSSFLIRFHEYLSGLIASQSFDLLPSDDHRSQLLSIFNSLSAEQDGFEYLTNRNLVTFERAMKTLKTFQNVHPLLVNTILNPLKGQFTRRLARAVAASQATNCKPDFELIKLEKDCSKIYNILKMDFKSTISNPAALQDITALTLTLRKTCFLIKLAGEVNSRLNDFAVEAVDVGIPNAQLLSLSMIKNWTEFAAKALTFLLSNNVEQSEVNSLICLILSAIKALQDGDFTQIFLPTSITCVLASIAGFPWYEATKHRLIKNFNCAGFLLDAKLDVIENLKDSTKALCLEVLCSPILIPWKGFIIEIVSSQMEPLPNPKFAICIMKLIQNESWVMRLFTWPFIILFMAHSEAAFDLTKNIEFRNVYASTIPKLPCLYYNIQSVLKSPKNLDRLLRPCKFCDKEEELKPKLIPLSDNVLIYILKLSLPILRGLFLPAKLELCKLISAVRAHSEGYSQTLIFEFTTAAAEGCPSLGSEIMKQFGVFFSRCPNPNKNSEDERLLGFKMCINTLTYQLQESFVAERSVSFTIKILTILKELVYSNSRALVKPNMALELLKLIIRLIMQKDSTMRNMLAQRLVTRMAKVAGCQPWELLTRLRYELAPKIVETIIYEFCATSAPEYIKSEQIRDFLSSFATIGEFRTNSIFIHHYFPILLAELIPSIHSDPTHVFILKTLSEFSAIPITSLLLDGFHIYYRNLVLNYGTDVTNAALRYLNLEYKIELSLMAENAAQTLINEMVSWLGERKEKVLKFIPPLFQKGVTEIGPVTLSRSEMQDLLYRHLMGYFVYVDTKLHSRLESAVTKRRILQSFSSLIEIMGKTRMTQNRSKVYTTLNSLFFLGRAFHPLIFECWRQFSLNLENHVIGSISVQILSAVSSMAETIPEKVEGLMAYFVSTQKVLTAEYYPELYFVADIVKDNALKTMILDKIDLKSSWVKFFELLVRNLAHENSHIRSRAIGKLHQILGTQYARVKEMLLDPEHESIAKLLSALLKASKSANRCTLDRLAECFGFLGAVDPFRFKNPHDEGNRRRAFILTVEGSGFAVVYLDLLIREFNESEDTTNFDYCACLIQELLRLFKVKALESDQIWHSLPQSTREAIDPLLNSKYKVEKSIPKHDMPNPIYLSKHGKTYNQWLSNWLTTMATYVQPDSRAGKLFDFSKHMVPRNTRIASFLLPYVATYAAMAANETQRYEIVSEIETIMQKWIEQDKEKVNSQLVEPVKESQAEEEAEAEFVSDTALFQDENVFQYRATIEVFSIFDHMWRAVRAAKRKAGLDRAHLRAHGARPPQVVVDTINPCVTEEQANVISKVMDSLSMKNISKVAFHCEDYSRALFYAELELKNSPGKLQDRLIYLQQLHVCLNDMDSALGVTAVRHREPTMNEVVCESFANGDVAAGVRNLELMVDDDPSDLYAASGLLQAYLSLDEPRKAETLIKGVVSRNPQWEVALEEYQIEAIWKMREWGKLSDQIQSTTCINIPKPSTIFGSQSCSQTPTKVPNSDQPAENWNLTIIKILSNIHLFEMDSATSLLNHTRFKLMSPLVAAANDANAYARCYHVVVKLHILAEVELVLELLRKIRIEGAVDELPGKIRHIIERWKDREDILLRSQKFVDPVLNVRKSLLEIVKDLAKPSGKTLELLNGSIRDCWLTAAKVESKALNFTRASNCIVEAKKCPSSSVMIEHAKLLNRKGDKLGALKLLNSQIPVYFPQVEGWKVGPEASGLIPERKLCAVALLLQAKLSDKLQLNDIEQNVKNYEAPCAVFKNNEKNYFTLAGYHDRIMTEQGNRSSATQERVVRLYAQSLHYGCKYVYQSLPRLLSIWFDFAGLGFENNGSNSNNSGGSGSRNKNSGKHDKNESPGDRPSGWQGSVSNMHHAIKTLSEKVPAFVFLTAFSQLISRICHQNPEVWNILKDVLGSIVVAHPHQSLWMSMAVSKSSFQTRRSRCLEMLKSVEKKKLGLKKTMNNYTSLADRLIELCLREVDPKDNKASLEQLCRSLPRLISSASFGDILVPFNAFLNPSLPPNGAFQNFNAFPQRFVFIKGVDDQVDIMHSLVRPKRIVLVGSDGRRYGILCKARDDLRKDAKVMEVNNVVNWYLKRDRESRERGLYVRVYSVTPLNEEHGLLEWVSNLGGLRGHIVSLYKERGVCLNMKEIKARLRSNDPIELKKRAFSEYCIKPYPPVFSDWFLNNFNDPQSWYKSRMCYVRTAAVMSIVGFIFGLGDRHGENISLDSTNGDIVHVDFNCLFNKGETFDCPERVPFRLTHNMIEGMGPLGVEGVFRRSCEITLNLFREHKEVFMSVLAPFIFDPLVEWERSSSSSWPTSNESKSNKFSVGEFKAKEHIKHISNRIDGYARNFTKQVNSQLSVSAQVAYLIDEARSIDNLCQMFLGWTAFL